MCIWYIFIHLNNNSNIFGFHKVYEVGNKCFDHSFFKTYTNIINDANKSTNMIFSITQYLEMFE